MNKFINGVQGEGSFLERLKEKMRYIDELDRSNPDEKKMYDESMRSIEIQYEELSKFFTEGFSLHLQNNLLMRNGKPIAVREGDDRKRMEQCHAKLTEDVYEQSSKRIGPDEESEGVAGKAFKGQYGNPPEPSGKGRKRTRKQKQKKRSKRKTYKYK